MDELKSMLADMEKFIIEMRTDNVVLRDGIKSLRRENTEVKII